MKNLIRNIYPGGNTPHGFYSYYNYILPQRKAEKIFCIKGGPGAGKSTMMKSIGRHFAEAGENVDYMWCSSDPESLDGIVLRDRGIAMIDGTSPHVTDPKNPGAVDKIINTGSFWNEKMLAGRRSEIISCSEDISMRFRMAYVYLALAGKQYEMMDEISRDVLGERGLADIRRQIDLKLSGVLSLRRAESKAMKDCALGGTCPVGEERRYFAGAITPMGFRNGLDSLLSCVDRVLEINMPVGFNGGSLIESVAGRLMDAGFDVEKYYCPMNPAGKPEHVIAPKARFAVVSANPYHAPDLSRWGKKAVRIDIENAMGSDHVMSDVLADLQSGSRKNMEQAIEYLEMAKHYHDKLEEYYIEAMDFSKVEELKKSVIEEIENM